MLEAFEVVPIEESSESTSTTTTTTTTPSNLPSPANSPASLPGGLGETGTPRAKGGEKKALGSFVIYLAQHLAKSAAKAGKKYSESIKFTVGNGNEVAGSCKVSLQFVKSFDPSSNPSVIAVGPPPPPPPPLAAPTATTTTTTTTTTTNTNVNANATVNGVENAATTGSPVPTGSPASTLAPPSSVPAPVSGATAMATTPTGQSPPPAPTRAKPPTPTTRSSTLSGTGPSVGSSSAMSHASDMRSVATASVPARPNNGGITSRTMGSTTASPVNSSEETHELWFHIHSVTGFQEGPPGPDGVPVLPSPFVTAKTGKDAAAQRSAYATTRVQKHTRNPVWSDVMKLTLSPEDIAHDYVLLSIVNRNDNMYLSRHQIPLSVLVVGHQYNIELCLSSETRFYFTMILYPSWGEKRRKYNDAGPLRIEASLQKIQLRSPIANKRVSAVVHVLPDASVYKTRVEQMLRGQHHPTYPYHTIHADRATDEYEAVRRKVLESDVRYFVTRPKVATALEWSDTFAFEQSHQELLASSPVLLAEFFWTDHHQLGARDSVNPDAGRWFPLKPFGYSTFTLADAVKRQAFDNMMEGTALTFKMVAIHLLPEGSGAGLVNASVNAVVQLWNPRAYAEIIDANRPKGPLGVAPSSARAALGPSNAGAVEKASFAAAAASSVASTPGRNAKYPNLMLSPRGSIGSRGSAGGSVAGAGSRSAGIVNHPTAPSPTPSLPGTSEMVVPSSATSAAGAGGLPNPNLAAMLGNSSSAGSLSAVGSEPMMNVLVSELQNKQVIIDRQQSLLDYREESLRSLVLIKTEIEAERNEADAEVARLRQVIADMTSNASGTIADERLDTLSQEALVARYADLARQHSRVQSKLKEVTTRLEDVQVQLIAKNDMERTYRQLKELHTEQNFALEKAQKSAKTYRKQMKAQQEVIDKYEEWLRIWKEKVRRRSDATSSNGSHLGDDLRMVELQRSNEELRSRLAASDLVSVGGRSTRSGSTAFAGESTAALKRELEAEKARARSLELDLAELRESLKNGTEMTLLVTRAETAEAKSAMLERELSELASSHSRSTMELRLALRETAGALVGLGGTVPSLAIAQDPEVAELTERRRKGTGGSGAHGIRA